MPSDASMTVPPGVHPERGFLAPSDPLEGFELERHGRPAADHLARLDGLATTLPDRLEAGDLRSAVRALEPPPSGCFDGLTRRETVRLRQVTAYLASAYVNALGRDPVDRLPAGVAVPLYRASTRLGMRPVLSYDVLCLQNYRRRDPGPGFAVENVEPIQRFTNREDERWFVAVHVAIEAAAAPALAGCARARRAMSGDGPAAGTSLRRALDSIAASLEAQTGAMRRMTEGNDPEVFASAFRPYFAGFDGVVYEGVEALDGEPQSFRGASGAQSSVLPAVDATLGVDHRATPLREVLGDMRRYMPPAHRHALARLESGPDVRRYVADRDEEPLVAAFNRCVDRLGEFRRVHFGQVVQYIRELSGGTAGTGGTDFVPFLEGMREETESLKL